MIFSSTIIPTIGRATLNRAVGSVLDQALAGEAFEVIVVNDSGRLLPEMDWQRSEKVTLLNTNCRERGVARNTGAAVAKGKYLHFLDDDDLLLPGALEAFWELAGSTGAPWLHGHYQSVDNQGAVLQEFDPEIEGEVFPYLVCGEAIPLQASLLRADTFFKVGAFDANISGVEDRDLGRRMALAGKTAGTRAVVAQIRVGREGSSTDWSAIAERDRWGRERALRAHGAFRKLRGTARGGYWRGRVCRAYLASMVWNLRRQELAIAASRGLASILLANWRIFSPQFWKGLGTKIR